MGGGSNGRGDNVSVREAVGGGICRYSRGGSTGWGGQPGVETEEVSL